MIAGDDVVFIVMTREEAEVLRQGCEDLREHLALKGMLQLTSDAHKVLGIDSYLPKESES